MSKKVIPSGIIRTTPNPVVVDGDEPEGNVTTISKDVVAKVRRRSSIEMKSKDMIQQIDNDAATMASELAVKESFIVRLAKNPKIDSFILLCIVINCIIMTFDSPSLDAKNNESLQTLLYSAEIIFTTIFAGEMLMKMAAYGIIRDKHAYLRDSWNILDCFVVCSSFTAFLPQQMKLPGASALRTFRALRPLRTINRIPSLRILVVTLINSVPQLSQAFTLGLFIFLLFGIVGLQLWEGSFYYRCFEPIENNSTCLTYDALSCIPEFDLNSNILCNPAVGCQSPGFVCIPFDYNPHLNLISYDNIFQAMITIFQVMNLLDWGNIMYWTMTSSGNMSVLYYIVLVPFCSFLFKNLLTAVVMNQFEHATKAAKERALLELQKMTDEIAIDENATQSHMQSTESESLNSSSSHSYKPEEKVEKPKVKVEGKEKRQEEKKDNHVADIHGKLSQNLSEIESVHSHDDSHNANSKKLLLPHIEPSLLTHKGAAINNQAIDLSPKYSLVLPQTEQAKNHDAQVVNDKAHLENHAVHPENQSNNNEHNNEAPKGPPKSPIMGSSSLKNMIGKHHKEIIAEVAPSMENIKSIKDLVKAAKAKKKKDEKMPSWENINEMIEAKKEAQAMKQNALMDIAGNSRERRKSIADKIKLEDTLKSIDGDESKIAKKKRNKSLNRRESLKRFLKEQDNPWFKDDIRFWFFEFQETKIMKVLSMMAMAINIIALASEYQGQPSYWKSFLETLNFALSIFFTFELCIKIPAIPLKKFWTDPFCILDFVIVLSAFPDMISFLENTSSSLNVNSFRVLRTFRMFRVLRVVKMVRYMESLQKIIKIIGASLPSMGWVILLILLFQFIFSIVGMQIFGSSTNFSHFQNFGTSFWTMFMLLTEVPIPDIMSEVTFYDGLVSSLFFVLWECVAVFILLNLLLVIILEKFEPDIPDEEPQKPHKEVVPVKPPSNISFFYFDENSKLRLTVWTLVTNKKFENFLYFCITCSCILLALDEPGLDPSSTRYFIQEQFNTFFTVYFAMEVILKCFSYGTRLYLDDGWNRLDVTIVSISILTDLFPQLSSLKVLRLLRSLRPLRLVKRNPGLKIAILALFKSILAMVNIMLFVLALWTVFGILGMNFFLGKFYSCNDPDFPGLIDPLYGSKLGDPSLGGGCFGNFSIPDPINSNVNITIPRVWSNNVRNFDNIGNSILTLFQVTTLDDWEYVFDSSYASVEVGYQPVPETNIAAKPFFMIFIYISSLYVMKLFVGVVYNNFRLIKMQHDGSAFISEGQKKWIEAQKKVLKVSATQIWVLPDNVSPNSIRAIAFRLFQSAAFEYAIFGTIVLNTFFMCMTWYDEPAIVPEIRNISDWIFFSIFFSEAFVKLIALHSDYFLNDWNKFDFFIVCISFIDKIVGLFNPKLLPGTIIPFIKMLRLARISRMIRLIERVKSLKQMMNTLWWSIPSLANILLMLLLFLFMFSVLAMGIFGTCPRDGVDITELTNFETFSTAILTMFKLATGDKWSAIMYAYTPCLSISLLFFPLAFVFLNFFFLNLFISVILENFYENEEKEDDEESPFAKLDRQINELLAMWNLLDPKGTGVIHIKYAKYFLMAVEAPLGCKDFTGIEIKKKMSLIQADSLFDKNGKVCFKPLLFKLNVLAIQAISMEDMNDLADLDEELHHTSSKLLGSTGKFTSLLDAFSAYKIQLKWRRQNRIIQKKKGVNMFTSVYNYWGSNSSKYGKSSEIKNNSVMEGIQVKKSVLATKSKVVISVTSSLAKGVSPTSKSNSTDSNISLHAFDNNLRLRNDFNEEGEDNYNNEEKKETLGKVEKEKIVLKEEKKVVELKDGM